MPQKSLLVGENLFGTPDQATEFIANVLESSTEYSIIAADVDGTILLWNEGARRIYGYEPAEVVGRLNLAALHSPEGRAAGQPAEILASASRTGKWEGVVERSRSSGEPFSARVVVTPRLGTNREPVGFLLISKNISDELRLTDELQATQFYTRSLIESNIDALMTTDPIGVITDVNEQMAKLTGRPREELIGSLFKQYFTDGERAEAAIRQVLQAGKVTNYELTVRSASGDETVVSYNASTFRDAQGRLQGVFAAARDITEQKALEQLLRDSEAYSRGLIETSVEGLVTVDADGQITDVNEQICRMAGQSRDDLVGSQFAEHFVDADRAVAGVAETFEAGVVTDYVLTLATRDGRQLRVSFNASVFRDPAGQVRGIFASARDITDQFQLQTQLADERTYNRGLIEASLDGLVTVSPLMVITDVNESMCGMTGYSREDLIGTLFPDHFTSPKRASEGVRLTFDRQAVSNYELTLRTATGDERLVSFNAAVFGDEAGVVRGIFASARDVTEQGQLQTQLAEERAYNRGLIEASVDGLVTVDQALIITDVNEQMCRLVGKSRERVIGTLFPEYFTEPERAEAGVRQTFEQESVRDYVLTLRAVGETTLPVSFNAAVFRDSAGSVRGIFAAARDITNQQELERQLRDSQLYTRSLIESSIDPLMTTDPLGVISDVNQQMEALTGRTRDDLIGTPFKEHFTDPARAEEGVRTVLRDGRVTNYELTALGRDGKETVVSYNAANFYDQEGHLRGVFAAARDVTENKTLEEQLREQQTYLRGLIESSVDALVTVDPDGFITDVNEQMCRMSGYGRQELIGAPFAGYFTSPELARAGVTQTFRDGVVTEYALTLVSRTRRQLQVSFNASVFTDADGGVRGIFASARDVTDRVRLEEQLREQQAYLRGLIESSIDGLVTVDPEGFITDVNEQMCRMTEYERAELVGSAFKTYFTNPDQADLGVRRTFAENIVSNYELTLQTRGGRRSLVSFNASVYRSQDGRAEGIFASARDISDQFRLQAQLTEQQVYNRSLIEASADAQFAIAPDGVITDVNEEACQLTGYSRKHLANSEFSSYFTDADLAREGVSQTIVSGRLLGYELMLVTRNGRRVPVSVNAGVFADSAGHALGILAAARNITAQKELESQLRYSEFYARSLIDSNIDALMTTDPLGIITDVNQQMEQLTGHSREELLGSRFKDHFTDPALAEDGVRLVLRDGKVTNYELTARSSTGQETVVSYNATTLFDRDGRLQGVFAAARDVTERKAFEVELQEKNVALETASLAKDRFLASMSHELRTPLNAIIGFTGTMLMKLPGPLNVEQEKQLNTVQGSAKHLLSIINDLLDLAKIESGKVEIARELVDCAELAREVARILGPLAAAKELDFSVDAPTDPTVATTDRRALSQILINLVNNAIKFTPAGTVVLQVRADPARARVLLRVTDTGPGISAQDQEAIFGAFTRISDSERRESEGTGLGLHVSRRLADLLHAEIQVESALGRGSTFTLLVPA